MADVFISYHESSAGELAAQIARTLEANGISCWYAKRDIPTGADFARTIPPQIDACKVFLLILNKNAQTSEHIGNELALAFSRWNSKKDITIFPVKIGDFEEESWIKYYLIRAQILKMSVLDAERLQEIARQVAQQLQHELKSPTPLPVPQSHSHKIIKSGECGLFVNYTLDDNGVLTISGSGEMWDFTWNYKAQSRETPWWHERERISHVEIQDGVTAVGHGAFTDCDEIISVSIPDSVTTIKYKAFSGCKKLESVSIPDSVVRIGNKAFSYCGKLKSVTIPDSVTSVGGEAFNNCWSLGNVSIPANLQIAPNTFLPWTHVERRT